jgi:hypothetical protein
VPSRRIMIRARHRFRARTTNPCMAESCRSAGIDGRRRLYIIGRCGWPSPAQRSGKIRARARIDDRTRRRPARADIWMEPTGRRTRHG